MIVPLKAFNGSFAASIFWRKRVAGESLPRLSIAIYRICG